ncbi:conserved hypothetical protein [Bradyrhizobium sp. ORS 285]|nr:conserved hypothetical protein [Bradyrhizobium sp. ORS 285]
MYLSTQTKLIGLPNGPCKYETRSIHESWLSAIGTLTLRGRALKEAQDSIRSAGNVEWISAASAVARLKPYLDNSAYAAQMRICEHAYAKLIRAKARRYINDVEHSAFGVSFVQEDIELMIPADA